MNGARIFGGDGGGVKGGTIKFERPDPPISSPTRRPYYKQGVNPPPFPSSSSSIVLDFCPKPGGGKFPFWLYTNFLDI